MVALEFLQLLELAYLHLAADSGLGMVYHVSLVSFYVCVFPILTVYN